MRRRRLFPSYGMCLCIFLRGLLTHTPVSRMLKHGLRGLPWPRLCYSQSWLSPQTGFAAKALEGTSPRKQQLPSLLSSCFAK